MCGLRSDSEHLAILHEDVPHAVRLPAEVDEPAVVHHAVDDGGNHLVVPKDPSPAGELQVGRDDDVLPLVGVGEDPEHELGAVCVERQKPQLVDHEQARSRNLRHLPVEPALLPGAPQTHDKRHGGEETRLQAPVAGDPAAEQLPAARREPCARMLGHGMAPFAASLNYSQHAGAIPICHLQGINNVLALNN